MPICRTLIIWYLFCFYLLQCILFQLTVQNLQSFLTFSLNKEAKVKIINNHLDFILQNAKNTHNTTWKRLERMRISAI